MRESEHRMIKEKAIGSMGKSGGWGGTRDRRRGIHFEVFCWLV